MGVGWDGLDWDQRHAEIETTVGMVCGTVLGTGLFASRTRHQSVDESTSQSPVYQMRSKLWVASRLLTADD